MVCMVSGVLFQGWDNGTLSGCVTQDPGVGPSEVLASAILPTHTNVCVCVERGHTCVYTKLSSHLCHARHSCSIFTALLGVRMWTKLKIDVECRSTVIDVNVERRSKFIRKTRFLSSILGCSL